MGRSAAVPANIVGLGVGALLVVLFARRRRTAIGALTLTPRHLL